MIEADSQPNEIELLLQEGISQKEAKHFGAAAGKFTEAIIQAEKIGYHHGAFHGMLNIGTIWKLNARETGSENFAHLARTAFIQAREYTLANNMPEEEGVHATFLLGQAEYELGDFDQAVSLYQQSYDFYKEHPHSNAHLGDVQRHLGAALLRKGDKELGIKQMEDGLSAIRSYDEKDAQDKRNYVWETGALLSLADAYAENDHKKALTLTNEALEITQRESLVIRKEEAEKMLHKLQSN